MTWKHSLKEPASTPYRQWGVIDRLDSWSQQQAQPDRASLSLQMELDAIRYVYQTGAGTDLRPRQSTHRRGRRGYSSLAFSRPAASPTHSSSHLEYLRPRVTYADGQFR
ncbi:Transcriptional regulators (plasmid) [Klebsiella aerogenes]|nr:Transcriptional regulators [Klebsiella aerogenes]